jgi:flagellar protein FlbD
MASSLPADEVNIGPKTRRDGVSLETSAGMIQLTRLNNHPLAVNSDLIKFVEQAPDTVITLVNGEKLIVRETADQVLNRIVEFRRSVLQGIFPAWDHIAVVAPAVNVAPVSRHPEEQSER